MCRSIHIWHQLEQPVLKQALEYRALPAGWRAAAALQSGFTTQRDLGSENALYAELAGKRATVVNTAVPDRAAMGNVKFATKDG